jgi:hypothetical protein
MNQIYQDIDNLLRIHLCSYKLLLAKNAPERSLLFSTHFFEKVCK